MRLDALAHSLTKALFKLDLTNEQSHALYTTFAVSVTSDCTLCECDGNTEGKTKWYSYGNGLPSRESNTEPPE